MIEVIWKRVIESEGQVFKQIRGGEFTYSIDGNTIKLNRTNRFVSKKTLAEALKYVPLKNTIPLQRLQAPSYLFALLMDSRIKKNDW